MSDIAIRVENLSKQYRIGGPQVRSKTEVTLAPLPAEITPASDYKRRKKRMLGLLSPLGNRSREGQCDHDRCKEL